MSDATLLDSLKSRFGAAILNSEIARDEVTVFIARDQALEFFRALRDDPNLQFDFLTDVTAVDWIERKPRFEVVYQLNSLARGHRLRVKIGVDGGDPWVHSVTGLWRSADWLEREAFDMFGIDFKGHPDLRRILMYDSFEGHPLRKDYNFQKRQPIVPETDPVVRPLRPSR
ncbi:MAG TPA: NADH-quinone oxidoreductase subunit C [Candidatus Acidoferrales bacterium]|nr:NADH-quinone oxidoreductase subunit C [Candidatus Acidoferrales bacterium]